MIHCVDVDGWHEQGRSTMVNEYKVNKAGIIVSPGKFEGEAHYVPYLWDEVIGGGYADEVTDENGVLTSIITVSETEVEDFRKITGNDDLQVGTSFLLWESESGFVYCAVMDAPSLEIWLKSIEQQQEGDAEGMADQSIAEYNNNW